MPSLSYVLLEFPLSIFTLYDRKLRPAVSKHVEEGTIPWFIFWDEDKIRMFG
jgi:hypothetical protein